jgi:hypothetical protein
MKPSEFDGQPVLYIDALKIPHSGIVVGQSADESRILVQSDNPNVPEAQWHFSVQRDLIDAVLVQPAA